MNAGGSQVSAEDISTPPSKSELLQAFNDKALESPREVIELRLLRNFSLHGSIVDIETTSLEPDAGNILTLGILSQTGIRIHQVTSASPHNSYTLLEVLENSPRPWWAYNNKFEIEWTCREPSHQLRIWIELCEPHPSNSDYCRKLKDLAPDPTQEFDIDGKDVSAQWKEFQKTSNTKFLFEIVYHNFKDLLREYWVYENRMAQAIGA